MTKAEAHALLESARAGANVSEQRITEALIATGDVIDGKPIRNHMPVGTWERPTASRYLARAKVFDGLAA